jgi:putative Ca2+/H+ antiporter (TMEM165/GDT1 family)
MDWRLLATTFITILFAELGDKTQLATLSFASGTSSRWAVFAGASLALLVTSGMAVLAGDALGRFVSPTLLRRIAGASFIGIGLIFLFGRNLG